ncbi:MAG: 1-deoxy-D-xylulose-5-phosphate synthase [Deltaproteobacteria bacterium]|nr:1-deoxy-D-xylulose-5-phosphate synthase [Deltaproteobacteria bacterium]
MSNLLNEISHVSEIRSLPVRKLNHLADDCRQRIIEVVSQTGGHLASSLGAVELTVALLKVFDFEKDKIVWDVGHQAYTYKILTGRNQVFDKLGKKGGISKFLSSRESKFDHFGAGHASTSISATLGMSVARTLSGEDHSVIAVIGDGSMTGGMAFEALNHAGHLDENLIVILNDNEMSIDPVVGALSKTIINISTSKTYNLLRGELFSSTKHKKIPLAIRNTLRKVNDSFMAFFTQGIWFEKLNFRYFGQMDGHNIKDLVTLFKVVKKLKGPILLHIATQKGKGYSHAEGDSLAFHGVGAFERQSGKQINRNLKGKSYTSIWSESFEFIMQEDKKIVAISAAMLANTGLSEIKNRFPERVFDVGIAEGHAVTFAGGLASQGFKPFVVIYSTFLQRSFDQIVHDVSLQNLSVRFILDRAGFVGGDGATHHGVLDLSYLRMIPNMVVMAPKNGSELQSMIKLMQHYDEGPIALRFPRSQTEEYHDFTQEIPPDILFGKGEMIREGVDLLLVAVGTMVDSAIQLAENLLLSGISVGVINARFVKPLDRHLILNAVSKVKAVATLEENALAGGFGSGVMELLSQTGICIPFVCFGIPDQFIEHASREEQLVQSGLDIDTMTKRLQDFCNKVVQNKMRLN